MSQSIRPLVSVIVPVYNAERYLRYCVESILGQSHENLEVILVDDGSTDSSPEVCDSYAARDSRVRVIHQSNGGIAAAQNAGLDAARGEYIAFSDNDDILDRRNVELLLHAIDATGADMSKARWRQFGVSQLNEVAGRAARGADAPTTVTVFRDPLRAYQSVFCKSLRALGDMLGRRAEARYFNEANWCRLYRRELWDGLRFPEGMYAQDVMVAGRLYLRMGKVADIDANLYNWLQSPGSVTHRERGFMFHHDNFAAGAANFRLCLDHGVLPARSYYTLVGALREEAAAPDSGAAAFRAVYDADKAMGDELLSCLMPLQRMRCETLRRIRLSEKYVYDRRVKNMR